MFKVIETYKDRKTECTYYFNSIKSAYFFINYNRLPSLHNTDEDDDMTEDSTDYEMLHSYSDDEPYVEVNWRDDRGTIDIVKWEIQESEDPFIGIQFQVGDMLVFQDYEGNIRRDCVHSVCYENVYEKYVNCNAVSLYLDDTFNITRMSRQYFLQEIWRRVDDETYKKIWGIF